MRPFMLSMHADRDSYLFVDIMLCVCNVVMVLQLQFDCMLIRISSGESNRIGSNRLGL